MPALLSQRLYWLAVALLRLDQPELALKSLASAQKLRPRGHARGAYAARANEYGMLRRATSELDDFYAFYSIQVCRYLAAQRGGRFSSHEEKDVVTRLVAQAWAELKRSGRLSQKTCGGKLTLFRAWPVRFPGQTTALSLMANHNGREAPARSCHESIEVDFRSGKVLGAEDRCRCGSGLPFAQCCGRIKSLREL